MKKKGRKRAVSGRKRVPVISPQDEIYSREDDLSEVEILRTLEFDTDTSSVGDEIGGTDLQLAKRKKRSCSKESRLMPSSSSSPKSRTRARSADSESDAPQEIEARSIGRRIASRNNSLVTDNDIELETCSIGETKTTKRGAITGNKKSCKVCLVEFRDLQSLDKHNGQNHIFQCTESEDLCEMRFVSKSHLVQHITQHHTRTTPSSRKKKIRPASGQTPAAAAEAVSSTTPPFGCGSGDSPPEVGKPPLRLLFHRISPGRQSLDTLIDCRNVEADCEMDAANRSAGKRRKSTSDALVTEAANASNFVSGDLPGMENIVRCILCNMFIEDPDIHGRKPHEHNCLKCTHSFRTKTDLINHLHFAHDEQATGFRQCDQCQEMVANQVFNRHRTRHVTACEQCSCRFTSRETMLNHFVRTHIWKTSLPEEQDGDRPASPVTQTADNEAVAAADEQVENAPTEEISGMGMIPQYESELEQDKSILEDISGATNAKKRRISGSSAAASSPERSSSAVSSPVSTSSPIVPTSTESKTTHTVTHPLVIFSTLPNFSLTSTGRQSPTRDLAPASPVVEGENEVAEGKGVSDEQEQDSPEADDVPSEQSFAPAEKSDGEHIDGQCADVLTSTAPLGEAASSTASASVMPENLNLTSVLHDKLVPYSDSDTDHVDTDNETSASDLDSPRRRKARTALPISALASSGPLVGSHVCPANVEPSDIDESNMPSAEESSQPDPSKASCSPEGSNSLLSSPPSSEVELKEPNLKSDSNGHPDVEENMAVTLEADANSSLDDDTTTSQACGGETCNDLKPEIEPMSSDVVADQAADVISENNVVTCRDVDSRAGAVKSDRSESNPCYETENPMLKTELASQKPTVGASECSSGHDEDNFFVKDEICQETGLNSEDVKRVTMAKSYQEAENNSFSAEIPVSNAMHDEDARSPQLDGADSNRTKEACTVLDSRSEKGESVIIELKSDSLLDSNASSSRKDDDELEGTDEACPASELKDESCDLSKLTEQSETENSSFDSVVELSNPLQDETSISLQNNDLHPKNKEEGRLCADLQVDKDSESFSCQKIKSSRFEAENVVINISSGTSDQDIHSERKTIQGIKNATFGSDNSASGPILGDNPYVSSSEKGDPESEMLNEADSESVSIDGYDNSLKNLHSAMLESGQEYTLRSLDKSVLSEVDPGGTSACIGEPMPIIGTDPCPRTGVADDSTDDAIMLDETSIDDSSVGSGKGEVSQSFASGPGGSTSESSVVLIESSPNKVEDGIDEAISPEMESMPLISAKEGVTSGVSVDRAIGPEISAKESTASVARDNALSPVKVLRSKRVKISFPKQKTAPMAKKLGKPLDAAWSSQRHRQEEDLEALENFNKDQDSTKKNIFFSEDINEKLENFDVKNIMLKEPVRRKSIFAEEEITVTNNSSSSKGTFQNRTANLLHTSVPNPKVDAHSDSETSFSLNGSSHSPEPSLPAMQFGAARSSPIMSMDFADRNISPELSCPKDGIDATPHWTAISTGQAANSSRQVEFSSSMLEKVEADFSGNHSASTDQSDRCEVSEPSSYQSSSGTGNKKDVDVEGIKCQLCTVMFKRKSSLQQHLNNHHKLGDNSLKKPTTPPQLSSKQVPSKRASPTPTVGAPTVFSGARERPFGGPATGRLLAAEPSNGGAVAKFRIPKKDSLGGGRPDISAGGPSKVLPKGGTTRSAILETEFFSKLDDLALQVGQEMKDRELETEPPQVTPSNPQKDDDIVRNRSKDRTKTPEQNDDDLIVIYDSDEHDPDLGKYSPKADKKATKEPSSKLGSDAASNTVVTGNNSPASVLRASNILEEDYLSDVDDLLIMTSDEEEGEDQGGRLLAHNDGEVGAAGPSTFDRKDLFLVGGSEPGRSSDSPTGGKNIKEKIECSMCGDKFKPSEYRVHSQKSHVYKCKYCFLQFTYVNGRDNHMNTVHAAELARKRRENLSICSICGSSFIRRAAYESHIKKGHYIKCQMYESNSCYRRFITKQMMHQHLVLEHSMPSRRTPAKSVAKKPSSVRNGLKKPGEKAARGSVKTDSSGSKRPSKSDASTSGSKGASRSDAAASASGSSDKKGRKKCTTTQPNQHGNGALDDFSSENEDLSEEPKDEPSRCELCLFTFAGFEDFLQHIDLPHDASCKLCNYTFVSQSDVDKHAFDVHKIVPPDRSNRRKAGRKPKNRRRTTPENNLPTNTKVSATGQPHPMDKRTAKSSSSSSSSSSKSSGNKKLVKCHLCGDEFEEILLHLESQHPNGKVIFNDATQSQKKGKIQEATTSRFGKGIRTSVDNKILEDLDLSDPLGKKDKSILDCWDLYDSDDDVLQCKICDSKFFGEQTFNKHRELDHALKCTEQGCSLRFVCKSDLKLHMQFVHKCHQMEIKGRNGLEGIVSVRQKRSKINEEIVQKVENWISSSVALERLISIMSGEMMSRRHQLFFDKREREMCNVFEVSRLIRLSNPQFLGDKDGFMDSFVLRALEKIVKENMDKLDPKLKDLGMDNNMIYLYSSTVLFPETFIHRHQTLGRSRKEAEKAFLEIVMDEKERTAIRTQMAEKTPIEENSDDSDAEDAWVDGDDLTDSEEEPTS